jgi:hypothetical protein
MNDSVARLPDPNDKPACNTHGGQGVTARSKDKYLGLIEKHYLRILEVYFLYEEKKPVMLFVTEGKIYAYPHKGFREELNAVAQMSLAKQYNQALRGGRFIIFIRDSQEKKLMSYSLVRSSVEQSDRLENDHELKQLEPTATSAVKRVGGDTRQQIYQIRRPGGGRKLTEEKYPTILTALERMLEDEVAGDPMTEQKWIRSSPRRLSERLTDEGYHVSGDTVARLLKKLGFSLKANKRKQGRLGCPDRDEQFKYIASQKQQFIRTRLPIISVDTKKKELIGDFRNKGKTWCRQAEEVNEHDFPGAAKCRAVPFGIYDPTRNEGYVYVGLSNDTPQFAVHSIARWWENEGRRKYPGANALLILADSGGSNGCRARAWKLSLQEMLCDEAGLTVTVCHYPTGCSKWNPIEHRLFNFISKNWEGQPLRTLEIMLGYIRGTSTVTGLSVKAFLDEGFYARGRRVTSDDIEGLRLKAHTVCPKWNYTLHPREAGSKGWR